jgi:O-antigen/teichoic acid export membrane protein
VFRKPLINTLVQVLGKGLTVILGLFLTAILIRKLGVDKYGYFVLISSIFIMLDGVADFGSKIIGVKEISANPNKASQIWRDIFWYRILMTVAAVFIGALFVWFWPGLAEVRGVAMFALITIMLTVVAGSLEIIWQWKLRMEYKVVGEVLFSGLFLLIVWRLNNEVNLWGVYGAVIVARILSLAVAAKLFLKTWKFKGTRFLKISLKRMRELLSICWPMGVYLLVFTSYDRVIDALMIDRFLGTEAVARYGLAYKIYGVLIQPAYFFTASVFPLMAAGGKNKLFAKSLGWLSLGLLLIIPPAFILSGWMIGVLAGEGFEQSVRVLRILLAALVFAYFNHLTGFQLISRGGQGKMLKLGVISLLFNLGANFLIVPKFGIIGAAGVTVATEALMLLLVMTTLRKLK